MAIAVSFGWAVALVFGARISALVSAGGIGAIAFLPSASSFGILGALDPMILLGPLAPCSLGSLAILAPSRQLSERGFLLNVGNGSTR